MGPDGLTRPSFYLLVAFGGGRRGCLSAAAYYSLRDGLRLPERSTTLGVRVDLLVGPGDVGLATVGLAVIVAAVIHLDDKHLRGAETSSSPLLICSLS